MPPPRKKTACGAACPRYRNNFRPQGRSMAVKRDCRAKAARTRAQKQPRAGGPGTVRRLRPWGSGGHRVRGGTGKRPPGLPAGAEGTPGRKNSPRRGRELCADYAHGRAADIMCGVVSGRHRTGHPVGQGYARAQKQPPAGPEAVWMRDMGVTCPGRSV